MTEVDERKGDICVFWRKRTPLRDSGTKKGSARIIRKAKQKRRERQGELKSNCRWNT